MHAYERFLRYIQFDTASSEASETCPSTPGQLVLGRALVKEMLEMGISDARMDQASCAPSMAAPMIPASLLRRASSMRAWGIPL